MPNSARVAATPQFAVGIFLMLFGLSLTLDRLGILDAGNAFRLWPLVLVALGVWIVKNRRDPRGRTWGYIIAFVGAWVLLNNLGIIAVGFWALFWPALLIWLGVTLVKQTLRRGGPQAQGAAGWAAGPGWPTDWMRYRPTLGSDPKGTVTLFAALGATKRACSDSPFRGGEMTAIMGGCHLDLRQAVIPPGEEAIIDVFSAMGGNEIWVPSDWIVESKVVPIMGGVDDKRLPPIERPASSEARPRLVVRGFVVMGGLMIKN
jgi:predicted membrane protein